MEDNTTESEGIGNVLMFLTLGPAIFVFFFWVVCAGIAAAIAASRERSPWAFGLATFFFLGPLGVGFALISPRGGVMDMWPSIPTQEPKRKVVDGRRRFECPRCGARNDIPEADTSYDCWRCNEHRNVKPKDAG